VTNQFEEKAKGDGWGRAHRRKGEMAAIQRNSMREDDLRCSRAIKWVGEDIVASAVFLGWTAGHMRKRGKGEQCCG
jgi:hypothetical protein